MEKIAKAIANNPHVRVDLHAQWNGPNHVSIEITGKAPSANARGKTQIHQIHELLQQAGIPHFYMGPEEVDGSKVTIFQRIANAKRGRWGTIVTHTRSKPWGNSSAQSLTAEDELKIRQLYQGLRSNGVKETRIPNK